MAWGYDSPRTASVRLTAESKEGSSLSRRISPTLLSTDSQLWGTKLDCDDQQGGLWVLVFPLSKKVGGVVDTEVPRHRPLHYAQKIFIRDKYTKKGGLPFTTNEETGEIAKVVTEGDFQNVVRNHIMKLCAESGFKVRCFESIDGDEVFMVLDIDEKPEDGRDESNVLRQLASRYDCFLPYRRDAYEHQEMEPPTPPKTRAGEVVYAYGEYEEHNREFLQDFRKVDKIRLVKTRLDHKMSLELLLQMKVISAYFPVQTRQDEDLLSQKWVWTWNLPERRQDLVREVFGEEIAFFFKWLEFYTAMLCPLVLATMFFFAFCPHFNGMHWARTLVLGTVILLWAALFGKLFSYSAARSQVRWGMQEHKSAFADLPSFRIDLQNTYQLNVQKFFIFCVEALYALLFICAVFYLKFSERSARERNEMDSIFVQHGSIITVVTIKVFALLWSNIAPGLVRLENLQTSQQWEGSLSRKVAGMTIFVALWNFVYLAFVRYHIPFTCRRTLDSVVRQVWGTLPASQAQKSALQEYFTYTSEDGDICLRGCFPLTPDQSFMKGRTGCDVSLEQDLLTFFVFDILVSVVFLVLPLFLIRNDIKREMRKAESAGKSFSWLQLQNKRFAQARYEYKSNGGSHVEDFMQFATNFALITCFGILYPPVILIALFTNLVEYKIMAYRMVHVTCRPEPRGSRGIGVWEEIFDSICQCAIVANAGLSVFHMYPARNWSLQAQLLSFVFLEHGLLALYNAVRAFLPAKPSDVAKIEAFNDNFLLTFERRHRLKVPTPEALGYSDISILLRDVEAQQESRS